MSFGALGEDRQGMVERDSALCSEDKRQSCARDDKLVCCDADRQEYLSKQKEASACKRPWAGTRYGPKKIGWPDFTFHPPERLQGSLGTGAQCAK